MIRTPDGRTNGDPAMDSYILSNSELLERGSYDFDS